MIPVPETYNRDDWPRLVANAINRIQQVLESNEASGLLDLNDGSGVLDLGGA